MPKARRPIAKSEEVTVNANIGDPISRMFVNFEVDT
jgi:hypothetical protein